MPQGRRHVVLLAVALALAAADAAVAQEPRALTAPAYPGNTLKIELDGPVVAGSVERVKLSGHAHWKRPVDETESGYDLFMYVQDGGIEPECEPWYGEQQQKIINVNLNATTSISGWAIDGDLAINPQPPSQDVDWAGESLPFVVRPGVEKVLLCLYQRFIIDDAASYQLPVEVEQPRCEPARRTVRRGRKLALKCNVSGAIKVRFRGPRSRTASGKLSTKDGSGTVSTRGLKRGRYRVTVRSGEMQLGKSFRIRVR